MGDGSDFAGDLQETSAGDCAERAVGADGAASTAEYYDWRGAAGLRELAIKGLVENKTGRFEESNRPVFVCGGR